MSRWNGQSNSKGGYSYALGVELDRKSEVWQRRFTDHRIRDVADFDAHREYIHENPVKRGLVTSGLGLSLLLSLPGIQTRPLALSG